MFTKVDHILKVIYPIITKNHPYYGYEERLFFAEKILESNMYLDKDEDIINTLNLLLDEQGK